MMKRTAAYLAVAVLVFCLDLANSDTSISEDFKKGETLFNSASQSSASKIFLNVIERLNGEKTKRTLTEEEFAILEKSFDYLGQIYFNDNQMEKSANAFLRLVEVNPNYALNEDLVSPKIVEMFQKTKQQNTGIVSVASVPKGASVTLDGRAIGVTDLPQLYLVKGNHVLEIVKEGYATERKEVTVTPGSRQKFSFPLKQEADAVALLLREKPEALQRYKEAIASDDKLKKAESLLEAGDLAYVRKEAPQAAEMYEQSLALFRESGDEAAVAKVLLKQGNLLQQQTDLAGALSKYEESLLLSRKTGSPDALAALLKMADMYMTRSDFQAAKARYEEALLLAGEDPAVSASIHFKLGNTLRSLKEPGAREHYTKALVIFVNVGDATSIAAVNRNLTDLRLQDKYRSSSLLNEGARLLNEGNYHESEEQFQEALKISREIEEKDNSATALLSLGFLLTRQGKDAEAKPMYEEALELSRATGNRRNEALALYDLAVTFYNLGDGTRANELYEESAKLYRDLGQQPQARPW